MISREESRFIAGWYKSAIINTEIITISIIRRLNDMEYKRALEDKLFEEYKEVLEAIGNDRIEELADMLEIMLSLANLQNKNLSDIIDVMEKKRIKRGAFTKKLFLEKVIE